MKFHTSRLINTVVLFIIPGFGGLCVAIFMFAIGSFGYGLFLSALFIFNICGIINAYFLKNLIIDEHGVQYKSLRKHYTMSWDEIKIVGIGYILIKAPGKETFLYFAADGISIPMLSWSMVSEKFFMISCRKQVLEVVRQYWHEPIDGLDGPSDFEKRIDYKRKLTKW